MRARQEQSRATVVRRLVGVRDADQVVGPLVRDQPADEQQIRPVVVVGVEHAAVRRDIQMAEIRDDRQNSRARKAQRGELLPVELGITDSQLAARSVREQFSASVEALAHELFVHAEEVLGRRDVVVHEHHPARQRKRRARRARPEREMMNQEIVGADLVHHVAVVDGEIFQSRVGGLDDDLGPKPGAREAHAECRAPRGRSRHRSPAWQGPGGPPDVRVPRVPVIAAPDHAGRTTPPGRPGRSVRRRRANQPGSGSIDGAGSRFSRSNMSRYLRSITGHA